MPEPPAPPSAIDLAAIAARAAAATPPPWVPFREDPAHPFPPRVVKERSFKISTPDEDDPRAAGMDPADMNIPIATIDRYEKSDAEAYANRDFICAARSDVPALVAYARALEAANARLREALAPLATVPLTDISPGEVARARALFDQGTLIAEDTPEMLARRVAWARKSSGW